MSDDAGRPSPVDETAIETLLAAVADPAAARAHLRALRESGVEPREEILAPLLRVLGASGSLARGIVSGGAPALDRFEQGLARAEVGADEHIAALAEATGGDFGDASLPALLRRHRRNEILRIGSRDLLELATVEDTVRELSALADGAVEVACRHARARALAEYGSFAAATPFRFVVLAMGKHGGEELNYSSDIDLLYLYGGGEDGTAGARREGSGPASVAARIGEIVTRTLGEVTDDGNVFRVDLRLRPEGQNGPIVNSLESALSYYEAWGQTWERAAMLKARPVGGDLDLGAEFLREIAPFIYRRFLDFETIEELQAMKRRVDGAHKSDRLARDVKLGPGGIREIEFIVQVLQLVHGGRDRRLRRRGTIDTLATAATIGLMEEGESEALAAAYRFLRDVEHKIQIFEERQTQLLPETPAEERILARRLGFSEAPSGGGGSVAPEVRRFRDELDRHRRVVRRSFERVFYGTRRDAGTEKEERARLLLEPSDRSETLERLRSLGFRDVEAAAENLVLIRDGSPGAPASARRKKALLTLAPSLIEEISASSDPDLALRHMAAFVAAIGARSSFLALLHENPETLRLLVGLFGSSEALSSFFVHHPELIDSLVRADLARVRKDRAELVSELESLLATAEDYEGELDTIRRFRNEESLRIGVNDLHGLLTLAEVQEQLSDLAEACLEGAIAVARRQVATRLGPPPGRFAVIGMGKLGGRELNYSSDLDLIFVWDAAGAAVEDGSAGEYFTKLAQRLMSALQVATREGYVYKIDTRLRPSGTQGPLVSTLESFRRYHRESALVWERQALIRARAVAGSRELGDEVERIVEEFVYGRGLADEDVAEIARLRRRMEEELARETERRWNLKTGRGGLVDVEFVTQMLQLRHGHDHPALRDRRTEGALEALRREGILTEQDYIGLRDGYRFLRSVESRLRLERDQPVEVVALEGTEIEALGRRLGFEGESVAVGAAFIEKLRRTRDEIRSTFESVFRGSP